MKGDRGCFSHPEGEHCLRYHTAQACFSLDPGPQPLVGPPRAPPLSVFALKMFSSAVWILSLQQLSAARSRGSCLLLTGPGVGACGHLPSPGLFFLPGLLHVP